MSAPIWSHSRCEQDPLQLSRVSLPMCLPIEFIMLPGSITRFQAPGRDLHPDTTRSSEISFIRSLSFDYIAGHLQLLRDCSKICSQSVDERMAVKYMLHRVFYRSVSLGGRTPEKSNSCHMVA